LERAPEQAAGEFKRIRIDTYIGMGVSNAVALFIIVTAAATLHAHGLTDIQTSSQAAEALRPISGPFAFFVFALGIIGTGLLALPVLAGSSAYALGETFGWHVGLARKPRRAKAFYGAIAVATLLGVALNVTSIDPIKALFWSAVINGVVAVPVMALMMHLSSHKAAMGDFKLHTGLKIVGWAATGVMALAAIGLFATWGQ
jgi:Mn2+/Fe2+ NRAMP family transporter